MREILDQYRQIMSTGQTSKENLCLKKLRFHHPWLRELSFNAFKMLFDLCEVVQIKKGEKDIICLHHGGRQITLLTPSDQQSEGECVTMMIKVAEAYIGDKISISEARLMKSELSETLKKE